MQFAARFLSAVESDRNSYHFLHSRWHWPHAPPGPQDLEPAVPEWSVVYPACVNRLVWVLEARKVVYGQRFDEGGIRSWGGPTGSRSTVADM